ncbi:hypothetical protein NEMBOFW57_002937 [Staphylotrichum longicolle]|uniref:Uncharacterized protein n=1 Tax=Staphylotrichum longicolle TaxID=669026 RepID=A0AAD4I276_9PEZI|nr:hypothetical protein NEMBOFW57_002937 [Staphylotrichum longicolle]
MTPLLTTLCHWLLLAWMAALPVHVHAQNPPQTCTFHLSADNSSLNQLQGGQVIGIQNPGTSGDHEGSLFRLQGGALYDPFSRGSPSTVLVCDLVPPVRPDPVFAIDEYGHLVYNGSQDKFWACPVEISGKEKEGTTESGWNYYLALPEGMAADPDQDGEGDDEDDEWDDDWDGGEDGRRDEKGGAEGVVGGW